MDRNEIVDKVMKTRVANEKASEFLDRLVEETGTAEIDYTGVDADNCDHALHDTFGRMTIAVRVEVSDQLHNARLTSVAVHHRQYQRRVALLPLPPPIEELKEKSAELMIQNIRSLYLKSDRVGADSPDVKFCRNIISDFFHCRVANRR